MIFHNIPIYEEKSKKISGACQKLSIQPMDPKIGKKLAPNIFRNCQEISGHSKKLFHFKTESRVKLTPLGKLVLGPFSVLTLNHLKAKNTSIQIELPPPLISLCKTPFSTSGNAKRKW